VNGRPMARWRRNADKQVPAFSGQRSARLDFDQTAGVRSRAAGRLRVGLRTPKARYSADLEDAPSIIVAFSCSFLPDRANLGFSVRPITSRGRNNQEAVPLRPQINCGVE
jgi:hypothetical protein